MSEVYVYLYDLSMGLAEQVSESIIGKKLKGIWHTGVVIFGKEIFFGSGGIEYCPPGGTTLRQPLEKIYMGTTEMNEKRFMEHVLSLSRTTFRGCDYKLFSHNCNNFSNTICDYLFGKGIPEYILRLPDEVSNTPMGFILKPFIENMANKIHVDQDPENGKHKFAKPIEESEFKDAFLTFEDISKFIYSESFESISMIEESFKKAIKNSTNTELFMQIKTAVTDSMNGNYVKMETLSLSHYNLLNLNENCKTYEEAFFVCYTFMSAFLSYPDIVPLMFVLYENQPGLFCLKTLAAKSNSLESAEGDCGQLSCQLDSLRAQLICNLLDLFRKNEKNFSLLQYRQAFDFVMIKSLIERLLTATAANKQVNDTMKPSPFQSGISLALNAALCREFSSDYGLEYGCYLIEFLDKLDENHGYSPDELLLLIKAIYTLCVRYKEVKDLAQIMDVLSKVKDIPFSPHMADMKDLLIKFLE